MRSFRSLRELRDRCVQPSDFQVKSAFSARPACASSY